MYDETIDVDILLDTETIDILDNNIYVEELAGDQVIRTLQAGVVSSVNGMDGDVILTTDDIDDSDSVNQYVTKEDKANWDDKQDTLIADTDYLRPSTASTTYQAKKLETELYVSSAEKNTWNSKQNTLTADTDYLTPATAGSTYQVKMGSDDNYVTDTEKSQLHTHLNKTDLDSVSGVNTGDQDLSGYEPLLPQTPEDPDVKFLNGNKQWVPIAIGGGGISSNVYYTVQPSDISGYSNLSYIPDTAETITSSTVTNQEILARKYLFSLPINTTAIDAGVWVSAYYAKVSGTQGITQIAIEPFLRHSDGSETTLFKTYSREINESNFVLIKDEVQQPIFNCLPTDRLGVRIYISTTASNAITFNTKLGGLTAGYFTTPLALRHDQLRDKNGNENYQHITSAEKTAITHSNRTALNNVSGTNTGDETASTIKTKLGTASTSTDGYLISTDWNTFNDKQNVLVSGENIATINNSSLLSGGDISIQTPLIAGTDYVTPTGASSTYVPYTGATDAVNLGTTGSLLSRLPPEHNITIPTNTYKIEYGTHIIDGSFNLTIEGNGQFILL